jgi:hypothetical protein
VATVQITHFKTTPIKVSPFNKLTECVRKLLLIGLPAPSRNAGFEHLFKFVKSPGRYIIRIVEVRVRVPETRRKFKVPGV